MRTPLVGALIALSALPVPVHAHAGHEERALWAPPVPLRSWQIAGRAAPLAASFVMARSGSVLLHPAGGKEIRIPAERLSAADREWVRDRTDALAALNGRATSAGVPVASQVAAGDAAGGTTADPMARAFAPFAKRLKIRLDDRYLYVESDGMPDHPMMKGIRSWQQQVPLPQPYTGENAWRIPRKPVLARNPVSARTGLFRGAIALAVNGVPIFNALNNRGEDAYLAGELDQWGGHCGRADDYHYHVAPLHLQEVVGKSQPIAYALDGFPIYGLTNPDGSPVGKLDELNGMQDGAGGYRYHATLKYPYVNGGLRGVVEVRGDQVEPQPRSYPVRPALPPLRGATVTGFTATGPGAYQLTFELGGERYSIDYAAEGAGLYRFTYRSPGGGQRTETYRRSPGEREGPGPPRHGGPGERPPRPGPPRAGSPRPGASNGM